MGTFATPASKTLSTLKASLRSCAETRGAVRQPPPQFKLWTNQNQFSCRPVRGPAVSQTHRLSSDASLHALVRCSVGSMPPLERLLR